MKHHIVFLFFIGCIFSKSFAQLPDVQETSSERVAVIYPRANTITPFQFYVGLGAAYVSSEVSIESFPSEKWTSNLGFADIGLKFNFSQFFAGLRASIYSRDKNIMMEPFEAKREMMGIIGLHLRSNPQASFYIMIGESQIPFKNGYGSAIIDQLKPHLIGFGFEYKVNPQMAFTLEAVSYEDQHFLDDAKVTFEQSSLKAGLRFYPAF